MADLLPSLSSDDENKNDSGNDSDDDDDDDDDGVAMDETFQFGGILGEDGGGIRTTTAAAGWSFQTALDTMQATALSSSSSALSSSIHHPRMDIDALIAAKRKALQQQQQQQQQQSEKKTALKEKGNSDDSSNNSEGDKENDDSESGSDGESNDSNDSDTDSSADEEMDDSHRDLEDDVLKTRAGAGKDKHKHEHDKVKAVKVAEEKAEANQSSENDDSNDDDSDEDDDDDDDDDDESKGGTMEERIESAKADAFFDNDAGNNNNNNNNSQQQNNNNNSIQVFAQLALSRPLLRGIAAMGFTTPTPIQAAVIPLALQGRDICASAVTGSGKTAAFLLPIAERLLHCSTNNHTGTTGTSGATRALILTPTRELAAQCLGMLTTFCSFTNRNQHGSNNNRNSNNHIKSSNNNTQLRASLIVGGSKNGPAQAAELRTRPDFIVATPGRLLDHVTNSTGVSLDDIEFLVLDEADRLLDLGFTDEIMQLVRACPSIHRQTLLFSATMNTKVDDLIQLSLKNPVRVKILSREQGTNGSGGGGSSSNSRNGIEVAPRLEQEFVRIRAGNEGANREGMLLALLTRTYTHQTICFFDTKVAAHRLMILAGLCGIKCAELHGNLTQQQRLTALEDFRRGDVDVLLATDLAARGLDIDKVKTVINFEMPSQIETYVHRIGRTARAGRGGRSCTLIGEGRRHLMKELIKDVESSKKRQSSSSNNNSSNNNSNNHAKGVIRSRSIPAAVIAHFSAKIQTLEPHLEEVLQAEAVARMDRIAEMEVQKAQNIILHSDEIKQRPQREWFATNSDKLTTKREAAAEKQRMIAEKAGTGMHRMTRKKRRARELSGIMEGGGSSDNDEREEHTQTKVSALKIKSDVRKQKRQQVEMNRETAGKSIRDIDVEQMQKAKKKKKKAASGDAAGDSSLFSEEKVSYAAKKEAKSPRGASTEEPVAKSSYNFIGYDPDKKLGKKKAHKAFKSKSKHKRR